MKKLDDLSPAEIEYINIYQRILPKLLAGGFDRKNIPLPENQKDFSARDLAKLLREYEKYKIIQKKVYFRPGDFNRGEYAMIRPINKELITYPQSIFRMVQSSNILAVTYLKKKKIMEIEFKNGYRYRYYKISYQLFKRLMGAKSHGKFFWKNIRLKPITYRRVA